jgi:preprotein translocase subunit SecG
VLVAPVLLTLVVVVVVLVVVLVLVRVQAGQSYGQSCCTRSIP